MNVNSDQSEAMSSTEDINGAFFEIILAENKFSEDGHRQGFAVGVRRGWKDGFDLGVVKGVQIGSEVAFYKGFSTAMKFLVKNNSGSSKMCRSFSSSCNSTGTSVITRETRLFKALDTLESSIETISSTAPTPSDSSVVFEMLEIIRARFKQICSLLGMSLESMGKPILEF